MFFFKDVNSFKNQFLDISELILLHCNHHTSNNLERLIAQLQNQVSIFKDKVINILQEISLPQATENASSVIQATSVTTRHDSIPDNINMNQSYSINNILAAQNTTQVITNTGV